MQSVQQVTPPFMWVVAAYDRGWRQIRFVERFINAISSLNLVGAVEAVTTGDDNRPEPVPDAPSRVAEILWRQTGPASVVAAGTAPQPWLLNVSSFTDAAGEISRLTFRFGGDFSDASRSNELWQAFRSSIGEENATCSYIDSWDRWFDLRDEAPPLVSGATLETILWANFIDAETVSKFRRDQLDLSPAKTAEWTNSGALYLRLADTLFPVEQAVRADMELRRRQVRESFLSARTY